MESLATKGRSLERPFHFTTMAPKALLLSFVVALLGCGSGFTAADEQAIRHVMDAQEQAWDSGDIDAFMVGYCDSVCFISKRGRTCGKDAVTANYKRHYPDKAAMGDLRFGDLEIIGAGADHAWCTGSWELVRQADTVGGGFSLFWQREAAGWRILRDHTY